MSTKNYKVIFAKQLALSFDETTFLFQILKNSTFIFKENPLDNFHNCIILLEKCIELQNDENEYLKIACLLGKLENLKYQFEVEDNEDEDYDDLDSDSESPSFKKLSEKEIIDIKQLNTKYLESSEDEICQDMLNFVTMENPELIKNGYQPNLISRVYVKFYKSRGINKFEHLDLPIRQKLVKAERKTYVLIENYISNHFIQNLESIVKKYYEFSSQMNLTKPNKQTIQKFAKFQGLYLTDIVVEKLKEVLKPTQG